MLKFEVTMPEEIWVAIWGSARQPSPVRSFTDRGIKFNGVDV